MLMLLFFLMSSLWVAAMPVDPNYRPIRQADGREVLVRAAGSERHNIFLTTDGLPVYRNAKTGNYDYALLERGFLIASGVPAANVGERTASEEAFLQSYKPELIFAWLQKEVMKSAHSHTFAKFNDYPTTGKQHSLVFLVEFDDLAFTQPNPKQLFTRMLNEKGFTHQNGARGSAADYYVQQSGGKFDPTFVVVGPIKVSKGYAYYGGNESGRKDVHVRELVKEVCRMADDSVDFSRFDSDHDGNVDNIFLFYAGHGESDYYNIDENVIWPHAWVTFGLQLDGKNIRGYACANEITARNQLNGIGTFCHEFGHVLGLPDFYVTTSGVNAVTPGAWSLMDVGCYNNGGHTPPNLSAYERAELGWHEYTELTEKTDTICVLPPFGQGQTDKSFRISVPGSNNEFYVLENRQNKGYDEYLPHHGMLVWHIDYNGAAWYGNRVNNDPNHQRVDIVEANGNDRKPQSSYPFPGTAQVTQHLFSAWDGSELMRITDITETDSVIRFLLDGTTFNLETPTGLKIDSVTKTTLHLSWEPTPAAVSYVLSVGMRAEAGDTVYLKNYTNKRLNTLSALIEGLTPATSYIVKLQSAFGVHRSTPAYFTVTTADTAFVERQVQGLPAAQVEATATTARWQAVKEADSYLVRLYQLTFAADTTHVVYGFDKLSEGLPQGWTTESTTYHQTKGYSVTPPSLRLFGNETLTLHPSASAVDSIRFWMRTPSPSGFLFIEAARNGRWEMIDSIAPSRVATKVGFATKNALAVRLRYAPAIYTRALFIDDVCAVYRELGATEVATATITATTHRFTNLSSQTTYAYSITAKKGTESSLASYPVDFTTATITGVAALEHAKGTLKVYDLMGRPLTAPLRPGIYLINGKKTIVR